MKPRFAGQSRGTTRTFCVQEAVAHRVRATPTVDKGGSRSFQSADVSQDFTYVGNNDVPSRRVRIRVDEAARPVAFALRSGHGVAGTPVGVSTCEGSFGESSLGFEAANVPRFC